MPALETPLRVELRTPRLIELGTGQHAHHADGHDGHPHRALAARDGDRVAQARRLARRPSSPPRSAISSSGHGHREQGQHGERRVDADRAGQDAAERRRHEGSRAAGGEQPAGRLRRPRRRSRAAPALPSTRSRRPRPAGGAPEQRRERRRQRETGAGRDHQHAGDARAAGGRRCGRPGCRAAPPARASRPSSPRAARRPRRRRAPASRAGSGRSGTNATSAAVIANAMP